MARGAVWVAHVPTPEFARNYTDNQTTQAPISATYAVLDGWPAYLFPDTGNVSVDIPFSMIFVNSTGGDAAYDPTKNGGLTVHFRGITPGASGAVVWQVLFDNVSPTESFRPESFAIGTFFTATTTVGALNVCTKTDFTLTAGSALLDSINSYEPVKMRFQRLATSTADTYNGVVAVHSIVAYQLGATT